MSKDEASILDIIEAIKRILVYMQGVDFNQLAENVEKQDAILRRIIVIGEATKRLSPEFRQSHPQVPWKDIAGMRDIVVHNYDQINIQVVWDVVQNDLPDLLTLLNSL